MYQVVKPLAGDREGDLRVIDEDGEDYIYSAERFVPIELPPRAKKVVMEAALVS